MATAVRCAVVDGALGTDWTTGSRLQLAGSAGGTDPRVVATPIRRHVAFPPAVGHVAFSPRSRKDAVHAYRPAAGETGSASPSPRRRDDVPRGSSAWQRAGKRFLAGERRALTCACPDERDAIAAGVTALGGGAGPQRRVEGEENIAVLRDWKGEDGARSSWIWRERGEEEDGKSSRSIGSCGDDGGGGFMSRRRTMLFAAATAMAGIATCAETGVGGRGKRAEAAERAAAAFTLEEVAREVTPRGELTPSELATVRLFEQSTYSVVNILDVTLRPQVNMTGSVEIPEGNGSGLIWDKKGRIVTNYHVIGNALELNPPLGTKVARVTVLNDDGTQSTYEGELVGADKRYDMAVLKIDIPPERQLRPIPLGQSTGLRVGQRCLAIGNPFGFDHTLTTGVISGLDRDIESRTGLVIGGGIQTDAAINPGNSGGPLLDSKGRLIGINTAIFTRSGTSSGVGFAIPVATVARMVPQLVAFGRVMRPSLNVQIAPEAAARQLMIPFGALVLAVPPNSAAAKAGLLPTRRGLGGNIIPGDVIVAVDGSPIKAPRDLDKVLQEKAVGEKVVLTVRREKSATDELTITLEEDSG
ncbi:hypothetical protein CBR_g37528 [Chara braunii]|uniref:PDZ domain-containing protein n=1 Tax=Chara braunii TaxID=69332 RepID=A0A388LN26_CHABU|nr:hypothetical protein CBR_g37528 [Chara braunii]|eukprot:GBG83727.1 hypothetical protein CBR_g37528 [Chara braunii]